VPTSPLAARPPASEVVVSLRPSFWLPSRNPKETILDQIRPLSLSRYVLNLLHRHFLSLFTSFWLQLLCSIAMPNECLIVCLWIWRILLVLVWLCVHSRNGVYIDIWFRNGQLKFEGKKHMKKHAYYEIDVGSGRVTRLLVGFIGSGSCVYYIKD
jgi:hypothetical protein